MTFNNYRIPAGSLTIRAGTSSLDSGGVLMNVTQVKIHAMYNITSYDYDYALIKLNGTLGLNNSTIVKVNLPEQQSFLPILGQLLVTGWGVTTVSFIFRLFVLFVFLMLYLKILIDKFYRFVNILERNQNTYNK